MTARARSSTLTPMPEPEPVGATEIAQRLGVKRETVNQWQYRGLLPPARWTVSGGPAWDWPDIERWARDTGRLKAATDEAR